MHEDGVQDETKEDVRMSARKKWYSPPYKPSRQLDMTREERLWLARYLRWNRSLKRVAPPGSPYTGKDLYVGRGDGPEFPAEVVILTAPAGPVYFRRPKRRP